MTKRKIDFFDHLFFLKFPVIIYSGEEVKNFLQFFTFCLMFFSLLNLLVGQDEKIRAAHVHSCNSLVLHFVIFSVDLY